MLNSLNDAVPFLTIVTRCCMRPAMMKQNIESVLGQTDWDLEQVFIVDRVKRGVHWANKQFGLHTHRVDGSYVCCLDDDAILTDAKFVACIKNVVAENDYPGVIMIKNLRPKIKPNILPKEGVWGNRDALRITSTNGGCFVVRADWWERYAHKFGSKAAGDWHFVKALRDDPDVSFFWYDRLMRRAVRLSRGTVQPNCPRTWFEDMVTKFNIEEISEGDWRLPLYQRGWQEYPMPQLEIAAPKPTEKNSERRRAKAKAEAKQRSKQQEETRKPVVRVPAVRPPPKKIIKPESKTQSPRRRQRAVTEPKHVWHFRRKKKGK